jgi:FkbM family methyltransferase
MAPFTTAHYVALWNSVSVYPRPAQVMTRYVFGSGTYPWACRVRTPLGTQEIHLDHADDLQTVTEVFCREDYAARSGIGTVVDIGSNIGVSALYFLTRNRRVRAHLFEPDPRNVGRLRRNLMGFEERYSLQECAVADRDGIVDFGIEETGRYGGIGTGRAETIQVRCRDVNTVLDEVLVDAAEIDILKIDAEGVEEAIVQAIRPDVLERIKLLYFEVPEPIPPLHDGLFQHSRRMQIERLEQRAPASRPG